MRGPSIVLALACASASASAQEASPAMSERDMEALRGAIAACWNVGSLSSEAARAALTVRFDVNPDRTPDPESIALLDHDTTEAAAGEAFASARRAIIRCGASGLPLPSDEYDAWREMEITFSPLPGQ